MAFVPVPDTVRVSLEFVWAGQIIVITIGVKKPGGFTAPDYDNLATAIENWWDTNIKPGVSSLVALQMINILDLSSISAPSLNYPITPVKPGTNLSGSEALNVALVTSFKTDLRGRSFRGRIYMPGVPRGDSAGSGSVTATHAANRTISFLALSTLLTGLGMQHVVISRERFGVPLIIGDSTPVTEYFTETNLDSQRRRLIGRGI